MCLSHERRRRRPRRKRLHWNEQVRVKVIHNLGNYTPQERLDSWYSADEISGMEDEESGKPSPVVSVKALALAIESIRLRPTVFSLEGPPPVVSPRPVSPRSVVLSLEPNTTIRDLRACYENGSIDELLQALATTPHLVRFGTRMFADYAKLSHRRLALASNPKILGFLQRTMLPDNSEYPNVGLLLAREYAAETVRSLTATKECDRYLMGTTSLLVTLALVVQGGGPFLGTAARLHACIAIMNLSSSRTHRVEVAAIPRVLEAMRDVMLLGGGSNINDVASLKAISCLKNLSHAGANDSALLGTPGLIEALGRMAVETCSPETGATPYTANACLAIKNLTMSKFNKRRVFQTEGIVDALLTILERTAPRGGGSSSSNTRARITACSALSNLAMGCDNKTPMFRHPGLLKTTLKIIQTDRGEVGTKACWILWSLATAPQNHESMLRTGKGVLPLLVSVARENAARNSEARFKCVAALALLAESPKSTMPLLRSGALAPLLDILEEAGPDPHTWNDEMVDPDPQEWTYHSAFLCLDFLIHVARRRAAIPILRKAGVVELLTPLLTPDHGENFKAALVVLLLSRDDSNNHNRDDEDEEEPFDLLREAMTAIPRITASLHNHKTTLGRGGTKDHKDEILTLRTCVGCLSALTLGPYFLKKHLATELVYETLLGVVSGFCVEGGSAAVASRLSRDEDDELLGSVALAVRAMHSLTVHLIPKRGFSRLPFGWDLERRLLAALMSIEESKQKGLPEVTRKLAIDTRMRISWIQYKNTTTDHE